MKMPFKGDTAAKIARAHQDLQVVETTIAELRRQRETQLIDGELVEIERLDRDIGAYERQVAVFRDRLAGLQPRLEQEQVEHRQRQREQAIAAAEKILPSRMTAIEQLAAWSRQGIPLIEKLEAASKLKGWPSDLPKPYSSDIDDGRFLKALARSLSGLGDRDWDPTYAVAVIDDAVAVQRECHRNIIDDCRSSTLPDLKTESAAA